MDKNRNSGEPFLLKKTKISEEELSSLVRAGGILLDQNPAGKFEFLSADVRISSEKIRTWQRTHPMRPFYIAPLRDVTADIGIPQIMPVRLGGQPALLGSLGLAFRVDFRVIHVKGLRELIRETGRGDVCPADAAAAMQKELRGAAAVSLKNIFGEEPDYEELVSGFREGKLREPLRDVVFYVFCGKGLLPELDTFRILSISHGIVS